MGQKDEGEYIAKEYINELEAEMLAAAEGLEFERAAAIRDRIDEIRQSQGQEPAASAGSRSAQPQRGKRRRKSKRRQRLPRPKKPG